MKKWIICLILGLTFSAQAKVVLLDDKNQEIYRDGAGLYRYTKGEDVYKKSCGDISAYEVKRKCMEAERASWERGKTPDELKREGSLFSGKICVLSPKREKLYFYVEDGAVISKIHLFLTNYYFEKGADNADVLYDIRTEEPYTGEIVIGSVEGLAPRKEKATQFIVRQKYEQGLPVGEPQLSEKGK